MSNIAEGFESRTSGSFIRYLSIAKGSAGELRSQLYVARDQEYISSTIFYSLCEQSRKISSQVAKLIQYLKER
jgi:four helix bundle protein